MIDEIMCSCVVHHFSNWNVDVSHYMQKMKQSVSEMVSEPVEAASANVSMSEGQTSMPSSVAVCVDMDFPCRIVVKVSQRVASKDEVYDSPSSRSETRADDKTLTV